MSTTGTDLNEFQSKSDKGAFLLKTNRGNSTCWLCVRSIRNYSMYQEYISEGFGFINLIAFLPKMVIVDILAGARDFKASVTISTDLGTVLFCRIFNSSSNLIKFQGEDLQKLKQVPNSTLICTCRVIYSKSIIIPSTSCSISANNSEYLKSLLTDLKEYSSTMLKEKVHLQVGEETLVVNKAIICARSPVFARMFKNDMQESNDNRIVIEDINMPVLRALVLFLNSGLVQNSDFEFLCDLYYSANKYQIMELQMACIESIFDIVSLNNLMWVLKLALFHNDELLKAAAMALISANFNAIASTEDWKDFMSDNPVIGLMASTFFDF